ncbi:cyclic dehypoxanthinyl futalosine synthase [Archaeoglobus veneficus]|uniref:Cyclic dehypoxanthine futalosine synthase n=1 Tax=Archaeoglobus veneficus (strain DSM 11195 / SNP6) TaxID=693661 RepID=F2KNJ1_ARCVS|nr:cyclic dehypoxanthinyl futalosine synthase [Archaeoglobus veneficus]AEA46219.1 menaquinone biosynthesis protein [Archaeoglobus veneficus SNP6]
MRAELYEYVRKNLEGENLSFEEALRLFELPLPALGKIADEIRKRKCGDLVTFVVDRNINYTNVCTSKCKFCAFYARNDDEGYVLSLDEILKKIEEAVEVGATQILMQGGMNPELGIEWFENVFSEIKRRFPSIQLHALSPPEIYFLAKLEKCSVKEVLERLKNAGLDSLPGGGAEILSDRVRTQISPNKVDSRGWLEVMRTAHSIGLKGSATMMFGHIESDEDIVEHLFKIRDLQAETGGFTAFIPWTFQPERTELYGRVKHPAPATRYLQVLAISRIILHNIRNIQASWLTQGFEIATLALFFGANDFGGTMLEENVVRATGKPFQPARVEDIVRAVKSVGRPVAQRTTLYEILRYF